MNRFGLKPRELQVMQLLAEGANNEEIAAAVGLTRNSVKNVLTQAYDKTGMTGRVSLALWYLAHEKELV